ncbi:MAG: hypothetical protein UZ08_BCD001000604 [Candidatus Parvibacillus calidus]|nr:MAG: hypothetical protein UZ08_BCD001000604 [Candidatus Parvibacillus calidus]
MLHHLHNKEKYFILTIKKKSDFERAALLNNKPN